LDKSTDTRKRLNEAADFELTIKLGKLFHAETRRLKKSFANVLVRHSGVRMLRHHIIVRRRHRDVVVTLASSLVQAGLPCTKGKGSDQRPTLVGRQTERQ